LLCRHFRGGLALASELSVIASAGVTGGFEERAMSTIGAPSSNGPSANLQAQWKRGQTAGSAAQGDAPSQSFTEAPSPSFSAAGPQAAGVPSAPAAGSAGGKASTSGGTFPRFEPQTLQVLLALQTSDQ
jgi:hypothetical protein